MTVWRRKGTARSSAALSARIVTTSCSLGLRSRGSIPRPTGGTSTSANTELLYTPASAWESSGRSPGYVAFPTFERLSLFRGRYTGCILSLHFLPQLIQDLEARRGEIDRPLG